MEFEPTPNQTVTNGRRVDLILIHTMEFPEKGDAAEDVAKFFARPATKASAHFCIDSDSAVQCVNLKDVAWAAPGANHDGVQLEHAGFARQSPADWDDMYSRKMLARSAKIAASVVTEYDLPVTFLRAPDLAAGRRGISTHAEVSKAFRLSDHTDPGVGFPIQRYLAQILDALDRPPVDPPKTKPSPPILHKGDTGWRVKQAQKLLVAADQKLVPDGVFGVWTERAVRGFQRRAGLIGDGVIGPMTWKALWQHYYLDA